MTSNSEATWGADPLQLFGGFHTLKYSDNVTFRSSLTTDGTVRWSRQHLEPDVTASSDSASVELKVAFSDVDWRFLQSIYGWAALQWQAWARNTIRVIGDEAQNYLLYTDGVLEFWLDDELYFGGDYYTFRKAPLVLTLSPGDHHIDVRILRDVRVMGGVGEPVVEAKIELSRVDAGLQVDESTLR